MKRFALKFTVAIILLMNPAHIFAQSVERILFKGSELLYPLPKGFCDITEEIPSMTHVLSRTIGPIISAYGWYGVRALPAFCIFFLEFTFFIIIIYIIIL